MGGLRLEPLQTQASLITHIKEAAEGIDAIRKDLETLGTNPLITDVDMLLQRASCWHYTAPFECVFVLWRNSTMCVGYAAPSRQAHSSWLSKNTRGSLRACLSTAIQLQLWIVLGSILMAW